jgi:hypothetical protein
MRSIRIKAVSMMLWLRNDYFCVSRTARSSLAASRSLSRPNASFALIRSSSGTYAVKFSDTQNRTQNVHGTQVSSEIKIADGETADDDEVDVSVAKTLK